MYYRYDKEETEKWAVTTIARKYDKIYQGFEKNNETDGFDYVYTKEKVALEVSLVIPENEKRYYEYEKTMEKKGKANENRIKGLKRFEDGRIKHYGGSIDEIIHLTLERIKEKHNKALKHNSQGEFNRINLCLLINDGSLFGIETFRFYSKGLEQYIFDKIFFITQSKFIVYTKNEGIRECM